MAPASGSESGSEGEAEAIKPLFCATVADERRTDLRTPARRKPFTMKGKFSRRACCQPTAGRSTKHEQYIDVVPSVKRVTLSWLNTHREVYHACAACGQNFRGSGDKVSKFSQIQDLAKRGRCIGLLISRVCFRHFLFFVPSSASMAFTASCALEREPRVEVLHDPVTGYGRIVLWLSRSGYPSFGPSP